MTTMTKMKVRLNNGKSCGHSVFVDDKQIPLLRTYNDVDENPVMVVEHLGVEIAYGVTDGVVRFIGYVGPNSHGKRGFESHHTLNLKYLKDLNGQKLTTRGYRPKKESRKNADKTSDKNRIADRK